MAFQFLWTVKKFLCSHCIAEPESSVLVAGSRLSAVLALWNKGTRTFGSTRKRAFCHFERRALWDMFSIMLNGGSRKIPAEYSLLCCFRGVPFRQ
jgi:hypothetical protein